MNRMLLGLPLQAIALLTLTASLGIAADDVPDPFGRPEGFKEGKKAMYALWYEKGEWQLATTSKDMGKNSEKVTFSGRVSIEGDKVLGDINKLEKAKKGKDGDYVTVFRDYKGFDFRFATYGKTDDVHFKAGEKAKSITFKLLIDGKEDPKSILIGKKGLHPDKAEFTFPAHPVK